MPFRARSRDSGDGDELLTISPLSDAERLPRRTLPSPPKHPHATHTHSDAPRQSKWSTGNSPSCCVWPLMSNSRSFAVVIGPEAERGTPFYPSTMSLPLSWPTLTLLGRRVYMHDVLCSASSAAGLFHSPSPSHSSMFDSSAATTAVWELWLMAVVLRGAAPSVDGRTSCRHWTRSFVEGLLRWVPPVAGPQLLLHIHASHSAQRDGVGATMTVALCGVDDVAAVRQHWAALCRHWIGPSDEVTRATHVRRTFMAFEQHGLRVMGQKSVEGGSVAVMQLMRAMAAVAHMQMCILSPRSVEGHPRQLELLVALLTPLLAHVHGDAQIRNDHKHWSGSASHTHSYTRNSPHSAEQWVAAHWTSKSTLSFREFLTGIADWLAQRVVLALVSHVNVLLGNSHTERHERFVGESMQCVRLQFYHPEKHAVSRKEVHSSLHEALEDLGIQFGPNNAPTARGTYFDIPGAVPVTRWVIAQSAEEAKEMATALTKDETVEALECFTIGAFLTRYRVIFDALRLARTEGIESGQKEKNKKREDAMMHAGNRTEDEVLSPLPLLFAPTLRSFVYFSPLNQVRLICSAVGLDYGSSDNDEVKQWHAASSCNSELNRFNDVQWNPHNMAEDDAIGWLDCVRTIQAPTLCVEENTSLVHIYDATALEQLECARRESYTKLQQSASIVLQAFLRARWSWRWNAFPLRRRMWRRAAMIIQSTLRTHVSARLVRERLRGRVEQRVCNRVECRQPYQGNISREETVAPPLHTLLDTVTANTATGRIPNSLESIPAQGAKVTPIAEMGPVQSFTSSNEISVPHVTELIVDPLTPILRAADALWAMEMTGRALLTRAEWAERRRLLLTLEEWCRERHVRLPEYRERRMMAQQYVEAQRLWCVREEQRRQRQVLQYQQQQRKAQYEQQKRKQLQQQQEQEKKRQQEQQGAKKRSKPSPRPQPPSSRSDMHGMIVKRSETPLQAKRRSSSVTRSAVSSHSPNEVVIEIDMLDDTPAVLTLLRMERDDRTFVELSEKHTRHVLRRRRPFAALEVAEMVARRFLFLAGVIARQEMLARWRNVILPHCLVMEAMRGDFTATLVVLQDKPTRGGLALLRNRCINRMAQPVCRQPSQCRQQQQQQPPQGVRSVMRRERMELTKQRAEAQRMFLAKPDFERFGPFTSLNSNTSQSLPQEGVKTIRRKRRKTVTWADEKIEEDSP